MVSNVLKPAVIITISTHDAVPLDCESGKMLTLVCVDKGVVPIALKTRDIGKLNNVPVIENPPLAREPNTPADVASARTERRK